MIMLLLHSLAGLVVWLAWGPLCWLLRTLLLPWLLLLAATISWRAYKLLWPHLRLAHLRPAWLPPELLPAAGPRLRPIEARRVILVTGATSGIGLALAKHLYRRGYSVLAAYYDEREAGFAELRRLAAESLARSGRAGSKSAAAGNLLHLLELDVRQEASIRRAYEQCAEWLAQTDNFQLYGLINNAGLGSLQPFAWLQRQTITDLIETNLLGNLRMAREFLPLLIESRGRLVFVSSGLGLVPGATYATYGLTKQAQIYLASCLNMELRGRYGVQSVAVIPHNFIKNTNICAQNVANNELAWQQLKPIERQLYAQEFQEHFELARKLHSATEQLRAKQQPSSTEPTEPAGGGKPDTYRQRRDDNKHNQNTLAGKLVVLARRVYGFCADTLACLSGQNNALTLEESGCLECFEDALRLEEPPEQMFAGDHIFQLLVGSLLLSLPATCIGLLGPTVKPSLYK